MGKVKVTLPGDAPAPTEDVEEVNPLEMIKSLEDDLIIAQRALRRIAKINPALLPGGPHNKGFGKKFQVSLQKAQQEALEALLMMENYPNEHNHPVAQEARSAESTTEE